MEDKKAIREYIMSENNSLFVSPTILHIPKLKMDGKLLLQFIVCLDNGNGKGCFASTPYFAKRLNFSQRKVRRELEKLEKGDYVSRETLIKESKRFIHPNYEKLEKYIADESEKESEPKEETRADEVDTKKRERTKINNDEKELPHWIKPKVDIDGNPID